MCPNIRCDVFFWVYKFTSKDLNNAFEDDGEVVGDLCGGPAAEALETVRLERVADATVARILWETSKLEGKYEHMSIRI